MLQIHAHSPSVVNSPALDTIVSWLDYEHPNWSSFLSYILFSAELPFLPGVKALISSITYKAYLIRPPLFQISS